MRRRWMVSWLSLALFACGGEDLDSALGEVTVTPAELDFGPVWIGDRAEETLAFTNDGRVPAALAVGGLEAPFDGPATVSVPSAGEAYQLLSAVLVLEPPRRVRRRPAPRTTRTTRAAA